jgi:hypothetical protein
MFLKQGKPKVFKACQFKQKNTMEMWKFVRILNMYETIRFF